MDVLVLRSHISVKSFARYLAIQKHCCGEVGDMNVSLLEIFFKKKKKTKKSKREKDLYGSIND